MSSQQKQQAKQVLVAPATTALLTKEPVPTKKKQYQQYYCSSCGDTISLEHGMAAFRWQVKNSTYDYGTFCDDCYNSVNLGDVIMEMKAKSPKSKLHKLKQTFYVPEEAK